MQEQEKVKRFKILIFEFETLDRDIYFLVSSSAVWLTAIITAIWDFFESNPSKYHVGVDSVIGLALILIGSLLRAEAKHELGKYYSHFLRTVEGHKLVTNGIYRHIRHPAYLGALLMWFGIPILLRSMNGLLLMTLIVPCYIYRMKIEEELLINRFGSEYLDYMRRSKRLIPYIY